MHLQPHAPVETKDDMDQYNVGFANLVRLFPRDLLL